MPLYDFRCDECGLIFERFAGYEDRENECPECGRSCERILSLGRNAYREDAAWIESVLEVVDKDDKKPATKKFLEAPTRTNMKAWMKESGLRHMADGEFRNVDRERAEEIHHRNMTRVLLRQKRERETINVRG